LVQPRKAWESLGVSSHSEILLIYVIVCPTFLYCIYLELVYKGRDTVIGDRTPSRDVPSKCLLALTPAYPLPNGFSSIALANSLYI